MKQTTEVDDHAKLEALRKAIDEGDATGIAEGNPFDRVREAFGLQHGGPHERA